MIRKVIIITLLLIVVLPTAYIANQHRQIGSASNTSQAGISLFPDDTQFNEYIYVDPNVGNDANTGRLDNPVARVAVAQSLARQLVQAGTTKDIVVFLRGGYHQISSSLQFNSTDSRSDIKVTYAGYPGERAVISGHAVLPAQWEAVGNNVWKLNYSGPNSPKWSFASLYMNSELLERSRYPNQGYLRVSDINSNLKRISFNVDIPKFGPISTQAVFLNDWATSRSIVTEVRRDSKRDIVLATSAGFPDHLYNKAKLGGYGYLTNVPMELAAPKTWSYDDIEKVLYYKAKTGENPNTMHVVTPVAPQLMNIDGGSSTTKVENLWFVGLEFEFANGWYLPEDGYRGFQAGTFNQSSDGLARFQDFRSAIHVQNAKNIQFNNNRLAHVTGNGIHIGTGTESVKLLDNIFEDIGVNCIRIGDTYNIQGGHANSVVVNGNRVRRCGNIVADAVGIWEGFARNVSIISNTVSNLPYTGISLGWHWFPTNTSQRDNNIEGNRITNVMNVLADGGGIYTLGANPNTSIVSNMIDNVKRSPYASGSENNAIFFDHYTGGITVTHNSAYNIDSSNPFRYNLTNPSENSISNNYFGEVAKTMNQDAGTKLGVGATYSQYQLGLISAVANGSDLKISWGNVSGAELYDVIVSKYNIKKNVYEKISKKQTKELSIDIADLKSGQYSIQVRFKKNSLFSRKSSPVFITIEKIISNLNITNDYSVDHNLIEEESLDE